jgi:hypothetical protein
MIPMRMGFLGCAIAALVLSSGPASAMRNDLLDFRELEEPVDLVVVPGSASQSALQSATDALGNPILLQATLSQQLTSPGASGHASLDPDDLRGLVTEVQGASAGESIEVLVELAYSTLGVDLSGLGPDLFVGLEGAPTGLASFQALFFDADGDFSVFDFYQDLDRGFPDRFLVEDFHGLLGGQTDLDRIVQVSLLTRLEAFSPAEVVVESFGFVDVPEPATGVLLLLGIVGLAGARRGAR